MSTPSPDITCMKCSEKLEERKTLFAYLGFTFSSSLPRCPVCGQVYISEDYAVGKLHDVEKTLEDK